MIECNVLHFYFQVIESEQAEEDQKVQGEAEEKARRAAEDAECAEALFESLENKHDKLAELLNVALQSHNETSDGLSNLQGSRRRQRRRTSAGWLHRKRMATSKASEDGPRPQSFALLSPVLGNVDTTLQTPGPLEGLTIVNRPNFS